MTSGHGAESVIFAVDVDPEVGTEAAKGQSRLDLIKHCITLFAHNKRKINWRHRYGLASVKDGSTHWETPGVTGSVDVLLSALKALQPCGSPCALCELGSLVQLVHQFQARLTTSADAVVRVILFYCRSNVVPQWTTHREAGLVIDVVYLHDRPVEGVNQPQAIYSSLEEHVDVMTRRTDHNAYVMEMWGGNVKKMQCTTMSLMGHPLQRAPQHLLRLIPLDLALLAQPQQSAPSSSSRPPPAPDAAAQYLPSGLPPAAGRRISGPGNATSGGFGGGLGGGGSGSSGQKAVQAMMKSSYSAVTSVFKRDGGAGSSSAPASPPWFPPASIAASMQQPQTVSQAQLNQHLPLPPLPPPPPGGASVRSPSPSPLASGWGPAPP